MKTPALDSLIKDHLKTLAILKNGDSKSKGFGMLMDFSISSAVTQIGIALKKDLKELK